MTLARRHEILCSLDTSAWRNERDRVSDYDDYTILITMHHLRVNLKDEEFSPEQREESRRWLVSKGIEPDFEKHLAYMWSTVQGPGH